MIDVKLIASDMDNTLLTTKGELPPNFYKQIDELIRHDIDFAIASGRPLYTLVEFFDEIKNDLTFISDNGGAIQYRGDIIFKSLLEPQDYHRMIQYTLDNTHGIPILCGMDGAYIQKKDIAYKDFFSRFFTKINWLENLMDVNVEANKFTVYFPDHTSKKYYFENYIPTFEDNFSVTVGDTVWIDLTNKGIDKGQAMKFLGNNLDISTDQMMAFGDTYNDVEMLKAVKYSYIVANASEDMQQYANFQTKSNDEYGVSLVIDELLNHYRK